VPEYTHGSTSRTDLLGGPATKSRWIRLTRSTAEAEERAAPGASRAGQQVLLPGVAQGPDAHSGLPGHLTNTRIYAAPQAGRRYALGGIFTGHRSP
jgi:hypothetical protein